jgi:ubiquinone/menaquinone biosynthesis C-methylase UbiE
MSYRKFHWISSTDPQNKLQLEQLHHRMMQFYKNEATRDGYQVLIPTSHNATPEDPVSKAFVEWFKQQRFSNIVEVGCGNGRIFNYLQNFVPDGRYTGMEVDQQSIERNKKKWPHQHWMQSDVYSMTLPDESADLIFSMYVLEHLVYPKRALDLMYQKLKPGGFLALVFPDFTCTKRFPSQQLGLSLIQSAKQKIQQYRLLDALVSLYDSRVRLQRALKEVPNHLGHFMVNKEPACLQKGNTQVWADFDALYVASKREVAHWAKQLNASIIFPAGKSHPFDEHSFMVVVK